MQAMSTLEKAIQVAARAHAGTTDKQDKPYILHPIRVMLRCTNPEAQIVGILHDVVEDTELTHGDLAKEGFSLPILDALELVTHEKSVPYADYVIACKANPIAREVKLADLHDNAQLSRAMMRPEQLARDAKRVTRYLLSYRFLSDEISENDYRDAMKSVE
jgi:(p)ppGpp synthase/HD superfamily hydrolase